MKFKKIISALLASAMIFGISAFAADVKFDDEIKYKDADTVTVNLYHSASMTELDAFSSIAVDYDTSVFSVKTAETKQASSTATDYNSEGFVSWSNDQVTTTSTISTDPLMTIVFNVLDKSKVVGSIFRVNNDNTYLALVDTVFDCDSVSITVLADESGDDTVKAETQTSGSVKVTYPEGYTGDKNLDGKYIVFKDVVLQGTAVTADTRFDITYDGTTKRFGATLFETLGITGQGTLNAGSYGFGVAFDSDVNANDVTIATVNE